MLDPKDKYLGNLIIRTLSRLIASNVSMAIESLTSGATNLHVHVDGKDSIQIELSEDIVNSFVADPQSDDNIGIIKDIVEGCGITLEDMYIAEEIRDLQQTLL